MQLLTFVLNGINFGIPVSSVVSIESCTNVVGVPEAPANIRGIIRLHGEIVPIYNLALRFGYQVPRIQNIVVVSADGMKVGLEVERVQEILEVEDKQVIPMPGIMNATQNCFNDVASCKEGLVVLLDVRQLLSLEEQQGIRKIIEDNH